MTVQEVERLTGLDRGTIRYYETESFILPAREANGYRNYTDADVEKLRKVKLLRALDFSIEDIKAIDRDSGDFPGRLKARIASLEAREEDIEDAKRVLQSMLDDNARYESLDPGAYMSALERRPAELPPAAGEEPEDEAPEREPEEPEVLWRRYFARPLDFAFYNIG